MSPNGFGTIGPLGVIQVILTIGLLAAGVFAAVVRVERRVAIVLTIMAVLPLLIALVGTVFGMAHSAHVIESLKAPTPRDLSEGVRQSVLCTALGFASLLACGVTGAVALIRARDPEPQQPAM
jgi:hypothetical protein